MPSLGLKIFHSLPEAEENGSGELRPLRRLGSSMADELDVSKVKVARRLFRRYCVVIGLPLIVSVCIYKDYSRTQEYKRKEQGK